MFVVILELELLIVIFSWTSQNSTRSRHNAFCVCGEAAASFGMAVVELRLDPFMVLVFDGGRAVEFTAVCPGPSSWSLSSIIMSGSAEKRT